MMKKRTKNRHRKRETSLLDDYIKANRRGSREAEIELYGHPITYTKVVESKKKYRRSRDKFRGAFECPSFFFALSLLHHKDTVFATIRQIYSVNQC